jgi:hypothetical protein
MALLLAQIIATQSAAAQSAARRPKSSKGPRAVGLLQLAPNGKAYLIPVVIMYDGEFYDASAYKAAPVPMALERGIVYEGERTGVSQGLFTITGVLQGPNNTWKAEGTWLPEGAKAANAPHKAETTPRDLNPEEGPPVLRHGGPEKAKPSDSEPPPAPPAPTPAPSPAPDPPQAAPAPAPPPAEPDRNQPVLRRGKPAPTPPELPNPPVKAAAKPAAAANNAAAAKPASPPVQLIPAISDAAGPDPRPYSYATKPAEEEQLRKKVLVMAGDDVRARAQQLASASVGASTPVPASKPTRRASAQTKPPQPEFDDVQLRIFDLSSSNEPVLVLMAKAQMPQKSGGGAPDVQYLLTLVARQDIYGELHKAFSNITDTQHLDVIPQMDLIDAVDADGDGRGELLFRRTSDAGTAYSVYRVIGNQLWPLFEGAPGE